MKNKVNNEKNVNNKKKVIRISQFITYFIIAFMILQTFDFIEVVFSDKDAYEIRFEESIGVINHQKVFRLYRDGECVDDVDYNLYMQMDENGETDLKYCALMEQAKRVSYNLILSIMMFVVSLIASDAVNGSPFTHINARRLRIIGWLQFALALVPGLIVFTMHFFKFSYANLSMDVKSFYMFVIFFAIMVVAQVFDYGVKLQEDMDSIA